VFDASLTLRRAVSHIVGEAGKEDGRSEPEWSLTGSEKENLYREDDIARMVKKTHRRIKGR
jgi:hypothetical protein